MPCPAHLNDRDSNRLSLAQAASAGVPEGTCPATVPAQDSYGYDTADRLLPGGARGSLRYDGMGRTRVLPSVDTVDGGGDLAMDYYVDDLFAAISQGGRTSTFGLDPAARRTVRTDTQAATAGVSRTVSHYTGDDDNPDTVTESDNSLTRNIGSIGGLAAVVTRAGTAGAEVRLQLANLHGDITATVPVDAVEPGQMAVTETTEYGLPRAIPAPGTTMGRYGWLGTHQRDASTPGGLTLMGVRLYAPTLGRFLSVDPVEGGSANPYEYSAGDPVNKFDVDGRSWLSKKWNSFRSGISRTSGSAARWLTNSRWGKRLNTVCSFAIGPVPAACGVVYTAAYIRQGRYREAAWSAAGLVGGNVVTYAFKRGYSRAYTSARAAATKRFPVSRRPSRAWRATTYFSSELHGMATGKVFDHLGSRQR